MAIRSHIRLATAGAVIDALGGTNAAAEIAECGAQAMSNARAKNRLPYPTFLIFSDELRARGKQAPSTLWGIKPSRQKR